MYLKAGQFYSNGLPRNIGQFDGHYERWAECPPNGLRGVMGFNLDVLARLAGQRPDLPNGEGALHPPRGPGDALPCGER